MTSELKEIGKKIQQWEYDQAFPTANLSTILQINKQNAKKHKNPLS